MYINTETGQYPVSERDILALYPNTSFGTPFTPPATFANVFLAPQPEYNAYTQFVRELPPMLTDKGFYQQAWEVVEIERTAEEYSALLASLKEQKVKAVAEARRRTMDGGYIYNDVLWDSDANARIAYSELAMRFQAEPGFTTQWKASDGHWVEMNRELFQNVYAAGASYVQACFAWQKQKEAEISECATFEQLEQVSLNYA